MFRTKTNHQFILYILGPKQLSKDYIVMYQH